MSELIKSEVDKEYARHYTDLVIDFCKEVINIADNYNQFLLQTRMVSLFLMRRGIVFLGIIGYLLPSCQL